MHANVAGGWGGDAFHFSFCTSLVPHLSVSVFLLMARNVSEIVVKNRNLCGSGGGGSGGGL